MGRYGSYFRKLDIFFSGKQQGAVRTDQKMYSILIYNFRMVLTIFKVATSPSIFLTTRPYLAQHKTHKKLTINFGSTYDINLIIDANRDYH